MRIMLLKKVKRQDLKSFNCQKFRLSFNPQTYDKDKIVTCISQMKITFPEIFFKFKDPVLAKY